MIVMINGPFGVGKTSAAYLLKEKISNSIIYDPEEVGFMVRNIVTCDMKSDEENTGDFQDIKIWKELVVDVAERLVKTYHKNLIVPMTIWNVNRFKYIREGFQEIDKDVYHFCLLADKNTVFDRLTKRGDESGSWAFQQTEKCLNSFRGNQDVFQKLICTDNLSETQVCQEIVKSIETV